ncbi:uncharacterized protein [Ptychodera flava]|uniref:uncharacterized protein n=1 Tax=Ptychodera flava TaxID=63121 RepID=UPI00396A1494
MKPICVIVVILQLALSQNLENLGCWKDTGNRAIATLEGQDNRLDGSYHTRTDPITKCRDAALSRGFSVFAIQNGGWCASSIIAQDTYQKYGSVTNCANDGEGGAWANQVYRIPNAPVSDLQNLGCWTDTGNRAIPTLEGKDDRLDGSYPSRKDPIKKCKEAALSRGFAIFAVQNGGWCASSADAENTYQKYGRSNNCGGDGEGGGWANQVYRIKNVPAPGLENLGCWRDTRDRAIPTLERKDDILDGNYRSREEPIRKCKEAALSRGFSVFAIQNGGWCASSENAEDTFKKYGESDNCKDDGEGGKWANQVYKIPITDQLEDLGCWKDTSNRAIATLEGKDGRLDGSYTKRRDPITKCRDAALSRGFSVFAIQHGGWCASSIIAEDTYKKYGEADNCADDGEGGAGANQVYRIPNGPGT